MTGAGALRAAIPDLRAAGVPDAPRDARLLLAHAIGIAADRLTLHLGDALSDQSLSRFHTAVAARLRRQPIAQIIGHRLFWGRRFRVTQDTLDPRPETECLIAEALRRPFATLLDLGTGTGCILLTCLAEMPMAQGIGTDVSPQAIAVASANADALGLAGRATFQVADWFAGVDGRFDLITSNPPYIAAKDMPELSPEVRDWEPHLALSPGGDGLDAYRAIATGAVARLLSGGRLLLEIGPTQGAAVCGLLRAEGFDAVACLQDLDGRDRVVTAVKPFVRTSCGTAYQA